ncbi:MAG: 30S ribosomal protein S15 [Methanocellales archaeon]|nr:30S ribosomal protein S15 [Methanocellales archaeon]
MTKAQSTKERKARTKTRKPETPEGLGLSAKEIEKTILKLREQGKTSSEIGIVLRDRYGIPDIKKATGKKIVQVLKENKMDPKIPEDLQRLILRAVKLKTHLDHNPKDLHNKKAFQDTESRIRRLVKYYKREKVLPEEWVYDLNMARMLISR